MTWYPRVRTFLWLSCVGAATFIVWNSIYQHLPVQTSSLSLPSSYPTRTISNVAREQHACMNLAKLSLKFNNKPTLDIDDEGKFHLVTNVILFTHRAYNLEIRYNLTSIPTPDQVKARQKEVEETLQANLNHPIVAAVHVLFFHPATMVYLLHLNLKNCHKLVLHMTDRDPMVGVNLDYIQNYLQGKYVILLHQDNMLGSGWSDISFDLMRSNRIVYALTRHAPERYGCDAIGLGLCNNGTSYIGSHDAFALFVNQTFPSDVLKEVDFLPSALGTENVLIWYLRERLGYKVTNPCLVLKVYHNHCMPIREKERARYNRNGKNGLAPFTDSLS